MGLQNRNIRRLFIDDVRHPQGCIDYMRRRGFKNFMEYNLDWDIVRNYQEFTQYIIQNGVPDVVSFDHDLAEIHYNPDTWKESFVYEEETGYDCVKWLCRFCQENNVPLPTYYLHTMNKVGEVNMEKYLENFKRHIKL